MLSLGRKNRRRDIDGFTPVANGGLLDSEESGDVVFVASHVASEEGTATLREHEGDTIDEEVLAFGQGDGDIDGHTGGGGVSQDDILVEDLIETLIDFGIGDDDHDTLAVETGHIGIGSTEREGSGDSGSRHSGRGHGSQSRLSAVGEDDVASRDGGAVTLSVHNHSSSLDEVLEELGAVVGLGTHAQRSDSPRRSDARKLASEIDFSTLHELRGSLRICHNGLIGTEDGLTLGAFCTHDVTGTADERDDRINFCHNAFVLSYTIRLEYSSSNARATGDSTCKDEATNVGDDFDNDNPPRVVDLDFCVSRLDGVFDNLLDLFGCELDFHDKITLLFTDAKILKKSNQKHYIFIKIRNMLEINVGILHYIIYNLR